MRKIVSLDNTAKPLYEIQAFSELEEVEHIKAATLTEEEVIEVCRDAEVILFSATKLNENVISKLEKCKLIIRYGIGYDNVDIAAARQRGIFVCNSPKYGIIDVAEHTLSLILATAKRIVAMNDRMRGISWCANGIGKSVRLAGKKIGFLGFGNIGKAVCERTNAFGMQAIVYDPYVKDEVLEKYHAKAISFEDLLAEADFITCHLPLNEKTFHMLGREQFEKMKNSAILVNTSRGSVINEAQLIDALEAGEIAGVGLDVFEDEVGGIDKRLLSVPCVVLTPHVAWNTPEASVCLRYEVIDNVMRYLKGERPESIVNGL